jgi:ankyrin repeat protein
MKTILMLVISFLIMNSLAVHAEENSYAPTGVANQVIALVVKAAKENNQTLIGKYVELGGNVNVSDDKGYTPLIYAAYFGHEGLVDFLLNNGANACIKDKRGNTALMGAIFKGQVKIAFRLLKSECDVDQNNNANQTALMYATLFGRKQIAENLIAKGAKLEAQDANGNSAMSLAQDQFNQEMIALLEKHK